MKQKKRQWITLRYMLAIAALATATGCGSGNEGKDIDDDRGDYSIQVTILGVQDCGYVTHNLADPEERCYRGTCTADFYPNLSVIVQAFEDVGCSFGGWGGDCAFAGMSNECPLTVDKQYNITATFDPR